ncbi:NADH-quinone oxidoreductase subunit N [Sulfobacillus harzensis]|uniref:NADH-quinone oxidoreductase subunit N n=1 Tax=Sulfobacillus harzensis TaxID=2729629 RepID=A0A7Y0Q212_9FIRM|nr:NADH-quinone oxidoreductase subunit N [Sulfobacillus harzensis]NMP22683.1 NADH-quinone oxidoreductase subunit N [Sulfobacillus harzensis]
MSYALWPEYSVIIGIFITMFSVMAFKARSIQAYWVALTTIVASGLITVVDWGSPGFPASLYAHGLSVDAFSLVVNGLVLLAAGGALLIGWNDRRYGPDFPVLVLLAMLGMMVLGMANNFIVLFIGIELLSLPLYILAASHGPGPSGEAGLKYLLLGAFSSGILLFGLALLYGSSGTMVFTQLDPSHMIFPLAAGGLALTVVGLTFKLGIVPFHMWIPDVYEGSPTPVTSYMAFGTKVGAAAILMRFLFFGFSLDTGWWGPALGYLAVLTMVVGNLLALAQKDLKRLLAYSGIANAGYLLVGIAAHNMFGARALLFYLLPYGLAVLAAFAVIYMVAGERESLTVNDLSGLYRRSPWLAGFLAVAMLSMAGIPLTGGFVGKFYLIQAALFANQPGLAIGLVVGAMVGLAAYVRPLQRAFSAPSGEVDTQPIRWPLAGAIVLVVAVVGTIGLGVYPAPVVHIVNHSAAFYWLR